MADNYPFIGVLSIGGEKESSENIHLFSDGKLTIENKGVKKTLITYAPT
jgi:hypothetical protein